MVFEILHRLKLKGRLKITVNNLLRPLLIYIVNELFDEKNYYRKKRVYFSTTFNNRRIENICLLTS